MPDEWDRGARYDTRPAPRRLGAGALIGVALAAGITLRLWLAFVNTEANDNHLPVIRAIAFEHRVPARAEAWQAFQPKLYHTTVALVWRALPDKKPLTLIRTAQLVSCAAGVLTLLVVLQFLRERTLTSSSRALAFAVVALNPALVGINAQATNDSFVILFGSLTLYFAARLVARWRARELVPLVVAAVLAGVSKGNGLVVIIVVVATLAVVLCFPALSAPPARRRTAMTYGAAFFVLVVPAVWLIGPYATYQRELGTPFATNWGPSKRPHFFRPTVAERPGLTSIAHGLLTFRFIDLLRRPISTSHPTEYPVHRTSLWTRVYAQAHSARFEAWPPSWESREKDVIALTRTLLVLGLIPSIFFVIGALAVARDVIRQWTHSRAGEIARDSTTSAHGHVGILLLIAAVGYFAFVALYSIRLRDYSSMKTIFILPALPALATLLAIGIERVGQLTGRGTRRAPAVLSMGGLVLLLAAYVVDQSLLIRDLHRGAASAPIPSLWGRGNKPAG